jgi:transposase-like protein/IS1 family transposase
MACSSRGQSGAGNLKVHDIRRNRWRCTPCTKTFTARQGTPFFGLKTDPATVTLVVTLLAFGCPLQAIVHAFEIDARTVAAWQKKAGRHCQAVHEALVQQPRAVAHVEADEIRVRGQRRRVLWMALALCATTRLWLGGEVASSRDKHLARCLARRGRACCVFGAVLVVTDGWKAYQDAFLRAFRNKVYSGRRGAPRLVVWKQFVLAQTVKWQEAGRTLGIKVCHLFGEVRQIGCLLPEAQGLSTAYIERLNATFRQRLCGLCRRTRCLVRTERTLTSGMYLVGTLYNFCTVHQSVSLTHQPRTPAMAAGITTEIWSVGYLLCYQVAPLPYVAPKRRGRCPGKKALTDPDAAREHITA